MTRKLEVLFLISLISSIILSVHSVDSDDEYDDNIIEIRDSSEIEEEFGSDPTIEPLLGDSEENMTPDSSSGSDPNPPPPDQEEGENPSPSLPETPTIAPNPDPTEPSDPSRSGETMDVATNPDDPDPIETEEGNTPTVTGATNSPTPDLESPLKRVTQTVRTQPPTITRGSPPSRPPAVTVNYERTKTDNITYKMDLDKFIPKVDNAVSIIYHFLARMRNHAPIRHEFKELHDIFYVILLPLSSHEDSNKECLRRGARLYEISSQKRLDLLGEMKVKQLPINKVVEEGQSVKIWLDVEQDPDGTLNFPSGDPILTFIDRHTVPLEKGLPEGQCLYFDLTNKQYVKTLCSEQHLTVCYIKKTPQVMDEVLFLENINDKINDLQNIKPRKNAKTFLRIQISKLESGECPRENSASLFNALGLDQPIDSINEREYFDIQVYNFVIKRLRDDITNFNNILFNTNFENHLKLALAFSEDIKMLYDKTKRTLCFFQKIIKVTEKPRAVEMILKEVEHKLNETLHNSTRLNKAAIDKVVGDLEKELDHIKMNRPTHSKVMELINSAFRASLLSAGKDKTVEKIVINPNITVEKVIAQIMSRVTTLIKGDSAAEKAESMKQIEEALVRTLTQANETITSVFSQVNTTLIREFNFFGFSLLDIILASTSVILAFVAIVNSACLYKIRSLRKRRQYSESFNDLELTPIVKKSLQFGKDKVKEYNSNYSSADTLPSPKPTTRKSYYNQ